MSENISSAVPQKATRSQRQQVDQLRGVIRVLINKNERLKQPVLAAKMLAKHCQFLKDEVARLKERSYNYETGMSRAEKRAARLQQDLYKLQQGSKNSNEDDGVNPPKDTGISKGLPFYLPGSTQQMIDGLTAKNVSLMKSLQRALDGKMKTAVILEENIKLEGMVKALHEELGLKTSLLEHYESMMSESKPKDNVDELVRSIMEQRKECDNLKSKLRSFESYVKHLRERNTAIMEFAMVDLEKLHQQPTESADDDEKGAVGYGNKGESKNASAATSRDASRNGSKSCSRRESLKDIEAQTEFELQSTGIQTDSGVSNSSSGRGSVDESDMDDHGECKKQVEVLKNLLYEKESKEKLLQRKLLDMEETCRTLSMENEHNCSKMERMGQELLEEKRKTKELKELQEDSEAILKLMQERVDAVNQDHGEINTLKEELKEMQEKASEIPFLRQCLENYEEEIKSYSVERNDLIKEKDDAVKYVNQLTQQAQSFRNQMAEFQQEQATQQQRRQQEFMRRQEMRDTNPVQEPWQQSPLAAHRDNRRQVIVADGNSGSRYRFDEAPEHLMGRQGKQQGDMIHQAQRNRRLQEGSSRQRGLGEGFQSPEAGISQQDVDDDYQNYIESGTVKCGNCGERYPNSLFQDHFRDCSRNTSDRG